MDQYFDCSSRSQDGSWLLAEEPPPVELQRACRGLHGRCDLLRLAGKGGSVQLECGFDQRDELCGWGQHLPDIRSYIDTARTHGRDVMTVLHDLFLGNPWQPLAPARGVDPGGSEQD